MADLSTQYMGMTLDSPLIVGSCGLTRSVKRIVEFAEHGAGAVVLKSIFEEEIAFEFQELIEEASPGAYNLEGFDYYDFQVKEERISHYMDLISSAKKAVDIPIIASVNCMYSHEWAFFARRLESAGADALELNMFLSPFDTRRTGVEKEQFYLDTTHKVLSQVSIPVALKISYYSADLAGLIIKLSQTGISGLVLFNRFYSPDFDIDKLKIVPTHVLSSPSDLALSLRWIAAMAKRVECDLVASTGVHDGAALVKQILAGAQAVQVVSALYRHGAAHIQTMLQTLQEFMVRHEYYALDQFRGLLSQAKDDDPEVYERFQFMKHFGGLQ